MGIFATNLKDIGARNDARKTQDDAVFGITKFTDLTGAEYKDAMLMHKPIHVSKKQQQKIASIKNKIASNNAALPAVFDWRSQKAVTPVKDQGQCGSCWSFSTTENIESVYILAGKANASTLRLSPQQLVDCSDLNMGCNGGNPPDAYESVYYEGGLETEAQYPYTGVDGTCALKNGRAAAGSVQIASWKLVSSYFDESSMQVSGDSCCVFCFSRAHCLVWLGGDRTVERVRRREQLAELRVGRDDRLAVRVDQPA
jgi:hypothetical protein